MMKKMFAVVATAAALVGVPSTAFAWWNPDWNFRKELTLDLTPQGADIAGSPFDVPVLVRLSLGNFEFFGDAQPDGADVRFVLGDDKTPLQFHVERWDAAAQIALVWVRVPRLSGGAATDRIYMYYGSADAPSGSDAAATYDRNMALVYHFGSTGAPVDATANATNPMSSTISPVAASLIGAGAKFDGAASLVIPASGAAKLVPSAGFTLSAWLKLDQAPADAAIATLEGAGGDLVFGIRGSKLYARAGAVEAVQASGDVAPATWHHVALRAGEGRIALFVDGVEVGAADAALAELADTLTIGAAAGLPGFAGELDELQVSNVARAPEWLRAQARSQSIDGALVVYGADSQKDSGHTSYFGTIAKNLTVDGWVVIVICMIMLVIALLIMALKALYLSRVESANRRFIQEYEALKGDTRALDTPITEEQQEFAEASPAMAALAGEGGKYGASTLFSLYHIGMQELDKRVAKSVGAARVQTLSPQSIEAIRAALDATATRIQQKLSAQMVLLTIAISGGPFLGLLGTVIGVMITFAAIAASGDVNVNAIAPGTAAALAATVAGLAVAIPCLFGYNWLNTRIKAIGADNRVFLDELVARMAEQYS